MATRPSQILDLARSLQAQSAASEAHARSAVSRAYYAAYHAAREFHIGLAEPGYMPPPRPGHKDEAAGIHVELVLRLQNPASKVRKASSKIAATSVAIGSVLDALRLNRVLADYRLDEAVSEELAREALSSAESILSRCAPAQMQKSA